MPFKYVKPVRARAASGLLADVYRQIRSEFGFLAEPFTLHSPDPELLAAVWSLEREAVICGEVPRPAKEAVASSISAANTCPFCAEAHAVLTESAGDRQASRALLGRSPAMIADPETRAMAEWAAATAARGDRRLSKPPFTPAEAPEMLGTALAYHYVNRVVSVLLSARITPIPMGPLSRAAQKGVALYARRAARSRPEPGASLGALPDAPLPDDLEWAASAPAVAGAAARAAAQTERAGAEALPDSVRDLVTTRVGEWDGSPPPMGRSWLEDAIDPLPAEDLPAARLALLTALASYRVDESVVSDFRLAGPSDKQLVGAVAWAAFTAARGVTGWATSAQAPA